MKKKLALFIRTTKRILYENKRVLILIWSVSPFWVLYSCFVQFYEGIYPIFNNYTTKLMIDSVAASLEQKSMHQSIYVSLSLIISITVLLHIILAIKNYVDVSCIDKINLKINSKIMQKIAEKPYHHFESPEEMDKIDRVRGQGSGKCIEQFNYSCSLIFYDLVFGISTLLIMLKISWLISLLFIIVVSIRYVVNIKLSRYNHTNDKKLTNTRRKIAYLFNIAVTVIYAKEIKIFNTYDWINKRYENFCQKYNIAHEKYIRKSLPIGLGSSVASTILYIVGYYIIITNGISNGDSVGTIIFYTSNLSLFSSFLETLINHITAIYGSSLYTSDLFILLDENYGSIAMKSTTMETLKKISIKNVSFTYPGTERIILKNVNLEINRGESVCVVGRNGMGKSTLVTLILGLYSPDEGSICIDGEDISNVRNKGILYASAVFQDYAKYSLTLKENIIFGHEVSDEEIENLLYKVDFSKIELDNLPKGLQTFLNREYDEDGIVLSEGQWQRVAVARALCHNMPLLILDEPTSKLDPVSEENIYNVINANKGNKTVIMVSHRLSGAINADKIVAIDNGMIEGIGTHNELMKDCEIYRKMFNLQANRYLQKG
jgi:ATP-binding cassette, subfamily B, bacterial